MRLKVSLGVVAVLVLVGWLQNEANHRSVPDTVKAEAVLRTTILGQFRRLYAEFKNQGALAKSAKTVSESEFAQVDQYFAWRYLVEEFREMNKLEKAQVKDISGSIPEVWDRSRIPNFSIFAAYDSDSEETLEVWYREGLVQKGMLAKGFELNESIIK